MFTTFNISVDIISKYMLIVDNVQFIVSSESTFLKLLLYDFHRCHSVTLEDHQFKEPSNIFFLVYDFFFLLKPISHH